MNTKQIGSIVGIITGVIMIIVLTILTTSQNNDQNSLDFSYDSNIQIQNFLQSKGILMSAPLTFSNDAVMEHCRFFDNDSIQHQITYCTSTELKDSTGNFLGNIHMVGSTENPYLAIAIIQSDPFIAQESEIKYIIETMINSLVCECWSDMSPGGFDSISKWIDAAKEHHLEAEKITSRSEVNGLAQKQILLEITTNSEGYLWKLLVSK